MAETSGSPVGVSRATWSDAARKTARASHHASEPSRQPARSAGPAPMAPSFPECSARPRTPRPAASWPNNLKIGSGSCVSGGPRTRGMPSRRHSRARQPSSPPRRRPATCGRGRAKAPGPPAAPRAPTAVGLKPTQRSTPKEALGRPAPSRWPPSWCAHLPLVDDKPGMIVSADPSALMWRRSGAPPSAR